MNWFVLIPFVLGGAVIGVVTANVFKDWAFKKADEKYNMLDQPGKHLLRFLGFGLIPVIPIGLAWGTLCAMAL